MFREEKENSTLKAQRFAGKPGRVAALFVFGEDCAITGNWLAWLGAADLPAPRPDMAAVALSGVGKVYVTAVERGRAALAQAEADLKTLESRRAEAEGLLDKTELRAPMDGPGAYLDVTGGEQALRGAVLVRIADESAWEVRSDDLTELTIARVRVGDAATLTFDGIPDLEIPGRVKFIRPFGEKKRGDITYTVTIAPDRWDDRLRWNMTAQIAITPSR